MKMEMLILMGLMFISIIPFTFSTDWVRPIADNITLSTTNTYNYVETSNLSQANVLEYTRNYFYNYTESINWFNISNTPIMGNTTTEIWNVIDNGTFCELDGGTFSGDIDMDFNRILNSQSRFDNDKSLVLYIPSLKKNATHFEDYSGQDNHGKIFGAEQKFNGIQGEYMSFDGVDDKITINDVGHNKSLSVFIWTNLDKVNSFQSLISEDNEVGVSRDWYILVDSTGNRFRLTIWNESNNLFTVYPTVTGGVLINNWYHIGFVYDETTKIVSSYINGNFYTSFTTGILNDKASLLKIGDRTTTPFNGSIDEVAIYNRSLSSEEIKYLYVEGTKSFNNAENLTMGNDVLFIDTDNEKNYLKETYFSENIHLEDNQKQYFGDADDVSVGFDGTNLQFTAEVGIPYYEFDSAVQLDRGDGLTLLEFRRGDALMGLITTYLDDGIKLGVRGNNLANYNFMLVPYDFNNLDFDHTTQSPDPTFFIHSATNPNLNNKEWVSLTYESANNRSVLDVGVGEHLIKGNAIIEGDLNVTGNITGNNYYGEMWNYTTNISAWTFPIAEEGIYYNLTGLASDRRNGFLYTSTTGAQGGSYLTTQIAGRYKADIAFSFEGSNNNQLYSVTVSKNFLQSRNCYARRYVSTQAIVASMTVSCFIDLAEGDIINVQIENEAGTADIKIHAININLMRIGDL